MTVQKPQKVGHKAFATSIRSSLVSVAVKVLYLLPSTWRAFVLRILGKASSQDSATVSSPDLAALLDLNEVSDIAVGRINAVVICYNEAVRLPYFLEFYQSLGVDRFIVVDNGSTDGSREILEAHPSVTRFYSERSFAAHKTIWREALADTFLEDKWVLFPDADELLIYPGWPLHSLRWFTDYLDTESYDALFAPMVDMYPAEPLAQLNYQPGDSFIDACPYFDTDNYRLVPQTTSVEKWKTPPYRIHGGARERLFHSESEREQTKTDQLFLRLLFSLRRDTDPGWIRERLEACALGHLDGCLPVKPPNMSKVPLLRWRKGTRFQGSPHRVNFEYRLAPDWGTILHFKYLQDFELKVDDAVSRGQHMADALHYKLYQKKVPSLLTKPLMFENSKRLEDYDTLLDVGLMRASQALRHRLRAPY